MIRKAVPLFAFAVLSVALLTLVRAGESDKYTIKTSDNAPPKELSEPIQKLLGNTSVQLLAPDGRAICEVWIRKEIPADATPEQVKNGITYREVKQTEIFGAVQFLKDVTDYRKQKIKAGVYTLRLAYQPTDGKHTADVSEYQDFVAVISAKADTKPALLDPKVMQETSGDSISLGHPGIFMLCPNNKPGPMPELQARAKSHWVLNTRSTIVADGKATGAFLGIGLTLVGHSPAE